MADGELDPDDDDFVRRAFTRAGHESPRAPAGWERRVWAEIDARPARSAWWWLLPAALAAGVAVTLLWAGRRGPQPRPPSEVSLIALNVAVEPAARAATRGSALPGDTVVVRARGLTMPFTDVWLFRGSAAASARCGAGFSCTRQGASLQARAALGAAGRYVVVVVAAPGPLPPPAGSLDAAVADARARAAVVELSETIDVF